MPDDVVTPNDATPTGIIIDQGGEHRFAVSAATANTFVINSAIYLQTECTPDGRYIISSAPQITDEARTKARELLLRFLDEGQQAQYLADQFFELIGSRGNRYRVKPSRSGNVERLEEGKPVERFCCHPAPMLPNEDSMLAQKLLLETDEEAFCARANKWPVSEGSPGINVIGNPVEGGIWIQGGQCFNFGNNETQQQLQPIVDVAVGQYYVAQTAYGQVAMTPQLVQAMQEREAECGTPTS